MGDDEVRDALQALPEGRRLVVHYADVEGFRYKEIAEILDISLGTVMSRLHRGRANLRALLVDFAAARGYAAYSWGGAPQRSVMRCRAPRAAPPCSRLAEPVHTCR
jgi:transposase